MTSQVPDLRPGAARDGRGGAETRLVQRVAAARRSVHVPHVARQERAVATHDHRRQLAQTTVGRQGLLQATGKPGGLFCYKVIVSEFRVMALCVGLMLQGLSRATYIFKTRKDQIQILLL